MKMCVGGLVGHTASIGAKQRAVFLQKNPCCIWFTGLSGSGKSTLANALECRLNAVSKATFILDGDHVRRGLCRDLGMSAADRSENVRRTGEVAKLMVDAGLIVICAFISPYERDRRTVRSILKQNFYEIYLDTPLEICEQRDPKGLYKKARSGKLQNFTAISAPYETPRCPDLVIDTAVLQIDESVEQIMRLICAS